MARINYRMEYQKNLKLLYLSLGIGTLLLIIKFAAWWWTNSNAILTDALESIINIVAGIFALFSFSLALKPKDDDHPYGHGKVEFLSAGFEGALVLMAGIAIISKSIWDFSHPHVVQHLDWGLGLTALSGLTNFILGMMLVRQGKKINSITMEASGKHLQTDAYSSLGLILGLGIVMYSGLDLLDNVVAIIFGIIIIFMGYGLIRKSIAGVMDEQDGELMRDFVADLEKNRKEDWIDVHNTRIIQYGTDLHIDCHLTLPWYYNTRESHDVMKDFEDTVKGLSNRPVELFVHVDPCLPISCRICQKKSCKERLEENTQRIEWTLENITANKKHQD